MINTVIIDDFKSVLASRANQPMTQYFEARLADITTQLISVDEKLVKNLQGRAQEITEILGMLKKARERV